MNFGFVAMYLLAAFLQVFILLYIANYLVLKIFLNGDNPDNYAIPYLTGLGDLLGTGLLALAFYGTFFLNFKS